MPQLKTASREEMATFRSEGFLKINLVDVIGSAAFEGLRAGFHDAESRNFDFIDQRDWKSGEKPIMHRYHTLRYSYPAIDDVARSPLIGAFAAALAGVEHMRLYLAQTFIKVPGAPATPWHQDIPFAPVDRRGLMTFWIAVDDVDFEMGPMRYVPRSHRLGSLGQNFDYDVTRTDELPPEQRTGPTRSADDHADHLREDDLAFVGEPVTVTAKAGEAIIHDVYLLHGAGPNLSDRTRRAFSVQTMPADTHYTGAPKKEFDDLGLIPFKPFDHPEFPITF